MPQPPATSWAASTPSTRFAGGADPEGKGWVPNITPHADGLAAWSVKDFEFFLETGLTPDGASVTGNMADVILNTAKLTPDDRHAMAVYLKALPPRPARSRHGKKNEPGIWRELLHDPCPERMEREARSWLVLPAARARGACTRDGSAKAADQGSPRELGGARPLPRPRAQLAAERDDLNSA